MDQKDNDIADTGEATETIQQRKHPEPSFSGGSSKPDKKGKGKDTGD